MKTDIQKLNVEGAIIIQISLFNDGGELVSTKPVDVTETLTKQDIDSVIAEMTAVYEARDLEAEAAEKQKKLQLEAVADSIVNGFAAKADASIKG